MNLKYWSASGLALCGLLALSACDEENKAPVTNKEIQNKAAQAAADSIVFTDNQMIALLKRRLEILSKPGGMSYIVLISENGQPLMEDTVDGRPGSCQQRLTPPDRVERREIGGANNAYAFQVRAASGDSGVWGQSDQCIFWFGTDGAMRTWNGNYLTSDQPIRMNIKPMIVNVSQAPSNKP